MCGHILFAKISHEFSCPDWGYKLETLPTQQLNQPSLYTQQMPMYTDSLLKLQLCWNSIAYSLISEVFSSMYKSERKPLCVSLKTHLWILTWCTLSIEADLLIRTWITWHTQKIIFFWFWITQLFFISTKSHTAWNSCARRSDRYSGNCLIRHCSSQFPSSCAGFKQNCWNCASTTAPPWRQYAQETTQKLAFILHFSFSLYAAQNLFKRF